MNSTPNFKVALLGIGGVGGYFGGKLAAFYEGSNEVDIIFLARGANAKAIQEKGLKIIAPDGEIIAHPALVTENASATGPVDLFICATKAYGLEEGLEKYRECITGNTIVLPLLNGVDSRERILKILPDANVCEGCVYVVSRLTSPGVIMKTGNLNYLFFGSSVLENSRLQRIEQVLKVDGINAALDQNILLTVWEKFFFISAMATITSYADKSIGAVLENEKDKGLLIELLNELKHVIVAKKILLPDNIVQLTFQKMLSFPYEATSSMHADFKSGNQTELDSLTGYVVKLGEQLKVATPVYQSIYNALKMKTA